MDQKTVRKLEEKLGEAIADAIQRLGMKHLPLLPSQHTMEMMAKAATAVYEAAAENCRPKDRQD
jgi:MinD-like ATPase involved in chromosome partitioning or flagellar assembly